MLGAPGLRAGPELTPVPPASGRRPILSPGVSQAPGWGEAGPGLGSAWLPPTRHCRSGPCGRRPVGPSHERSLHSPLRPSRRHFPRVMPLSKPGRRGCPRHPRGVRGPPLWVPVARGVGWHGARDGSLLSQALGATLLLPVFGGPHGVRGSVLEQGSRVTVRWCPPCAPGGLGEEGSGGPGTSLRPMATWACLWGAGHPWDGACWPGRGAWPGAVSGGPVAHRGTWAHEAPAALWVSSLRCVFKGPVCVVTWAICLGP